MAWRGDPGRLTKLAYAERLTAALVLLLLRQRDAVGLIRFDDGVRTIVPPRSRSTQWRHVVAALDGPVSPRRMAAAVRASMRPSRRPRGWCAVPAWWCWCPIC